MKNDRTYINQRLAEINTASNAGEPPMGYWNAIRRAASAAARIRSAESKAPATVENAD